MKSAKRNWYVITGAPSSGKTTTVALLEGKGYRVVPEAAREYIDEEITKGRSIEDIRKDEVVFQKKVLEMKLAKEKTLPEDGTIFFDRGIPDSVAYYTLYGVGDDPELQRAVLRCSYEKVFFLDMVPHEKDYARTEDEVTQKRLHDLLLQAYRALHIPIVFIPVMKPEERVARILGEIFPSAA